MRLKIVSDGTRAGTNIYNADTGEKVRNVVAIDFHMTSDGGYTILKLVGDVEVEITNNAEAFNLNDKAIVLNTWE